MVEEEKRKKKEESAVLEATLATAQAELSLSWSWATVDQKGNFKFELFFYHKVSLLYIL